MGGWSVREHIGKQITSFGLLGFLSFPFRFRFPAPLAWIPDHWLLIMRARAYINTCSTMSRSRARTHVRTCIYTCGHECMRTHRLYHIPIYRRSDHSVTCTICSKWSSTARRCLCLSTVVQMRSMLGVGVIVQWRGSQLRRSRCSLRLSAQGSPWRRRPVSA